MARDNFPRKVVERLHSRVAHRCSNPDCRVPTSAPGSKSDAVTSIGVAAHIHAAAPGGPRFVGSMTPTERKSIDNAIWLCSSCSVLVDRDVERYSTELLRVWKAAAEDQAAKELGRRPATHDDARREVAAALTGLPTAFVPTAIANVHAASADALESLDPRFKVETSYEYRVTKFTLHAKEDVTMSLEVAPEVANEWSEKLRDLIEHGIAAEIDARGVRIKGSPLMERYITPSEREGASKYVLTPHGKPAVLKMSLVEPTTNQVVALDDIAGQIAPGRKSFTFTGSGFAGLLEVSIQKAVLQADPSGDFAMQIDFRKWEGRNVGQLPYFEIVAQLFQRIVNGWRVEIVLMIEGSMFLGAVVNLPSDSPQVSLPHVFLEYTRRARIVAAHLEQSVVVRLPLPTSESDHRRLADVADTFEMKRKIDRASLRSNPKCVLVASAGAENIRSLQQQRSPMLISFQRLDSGPLVIFGHSVKLPPTEIVLDGVVANVLQDVSEVQAGDPVSIEWVPAPEFSGEIRFVSESPVP